jgi:hypothetical protein
MLRTQDGVTGLGTAPSAQHCGIWEDNLRAWEWHHGLGDDACVLDRITNLGRGMWSMASPWLGRMARGLRGGIDDDTEALGRTRRWQELQGGQRWCGLQGKFQQGILAA